MRALLFHNAKIKEDHGWKERSLKEFLIDSSRAGYDAAQPQIRKEGLIFVSVNQISCVFKAVLKMAEPSERGKHGG